MDFDQMDVLALKRQMLAFASIDPLITLPTMLTFVRILELLAEANGQWVKQRDVRVGMPFTEASVSRALKYWSEFGDKQVSFIEFSMDPEDRRKHVIRLTPRGRAFVSTVFTRET